MAIKADPLEKTADEDILFSVDFTDLLNTDETISSATAVVDVGDTALTVDPPSVISTETTVKSKTIAANKGITVRILGGTVDQYYEVRASVVTSSSNTRQVDCPLTVQG